METNNRDIDAEASGSVLGNESFVMKIAFSQASNTRIPSRIDEKQTGRI